MADISVTYTPTSASVGVIDTPYVIITHDAESSPDSVFLLNQLTMIFTALVFEPWSEATDTRPLLLQVSHIKVSGEGGWGQYSTFSASDGDYVARAYYNYLMLLIVLENALISPALDLSSSETGFKLSFDALSSSYTETRLEVQISSQTQMLHQGGQLL